MSRKNVASLSQGTPLAIPVTVPSTSTGDSQSQPSLSTGQMVQVVPASGLTTSSTQQALPADARGVQRTRKRSSSGRTLMSGVPTAGSLLVSSARAGISQSGSAVGLSPPQTSQYVLSRSYQCTKCRKRFDEKSEFTEHLKQCCSALTELLLAGRPISPPLSLAGTRSVTSSLVSSARTTVTQTVSAPGLPPVQTSQCGRINPYQHINYPQRLNKKRGRVKSTPQRFPEPEQLQTRRPEPRVVLSPRGRLKTLSHETAVKKETVRQDRSDAVNMKRPSIKGTLAAEVSTASSNVEALRLFAAETQPHLDPLKGKITIDSHPLTSQVALLGEDRMWTGDVIQSSVEQSVSPVMHHPAPASDTSLLQEYPLGSGNTQQMDTSVDRYLLIPVYVLDMDSRVSSQELGGRGHQQSVTSSLVTGERDALLPMQQVAQPSRSDRGHSALIGRYSQTGEKLYTCDFCEQTFQTAYLKELHQHIHLREAISSCGQLGQTFESPSQRPMHQQTSSGDEASQREVCQMILRDHSDPARQSENKHLCKRRAESGEKEALTDRTMVKQSTPSCSESSPLPVASLTDFSTPVSGHQRSGSEPASQPLEQQAVVLADSAFALGAMVTVATQTGISPPVTEESDNAAPDYVYVRDNPNLRIRMFPEEDD